MPAKGHGAKQREEQERRDKERDIFTRVFEIAHDGADDAMKLALSVYKAQYLELNPFPKEGE